MSGNPQRPARALVRIRLAAVSGGVEGVAFASLCTARYQVFFPDFSSC